jgi:hypothetical protein
MGAQKTAAEAIGFLFMHDVFKLAENIFHKREKLPAQQVVHNPLVLVGFSSTHIGSTNMSGCAQFVHNLLCKDQLSSQNY